MSDCPPSPTQHGAGMVPTHWPADRTDVPEPAWTVRGLGSLPGMVLLWFQPARVGASLAASGWRAAIAAHALGLLVGLGMILFAEMLPELNPRAAQQQRFGLQVECDIDMPQMSWSDAVRAPFAAVAFLLHTSSSGPSGPAWPLLVVVAIEAGMVILAVALMPFAAAGEPAGRLFGRCLRLTWWSSTLLVPFGGGWLLNTLLQDQPGLLPEWHAVDAATVFGMWWLVVFVRSGYRYAGPADGPAWCPRTPRCEKCGYTITGLPRSTDCPECGRPVSESLPERRGQPAFAVARTCRGAVWAFFWTLCRAIFSGTFSERMAVHSGYAKARKFFLMVCGLDAAVAFVAVATLGHFYKLPGIFGNMLAAAAVAAGVWAFGHVLLAGLVNLLASIPGRRPVQPTAVATFYSLSALASLTISPVLLVLAGCCAEEALDRMWTGGLPTVLVGVLLALALGACALAMFVAVRNAVRAIRRTRFANA